MPNPESSPKAPQQNQSSDPSLPATTTFQQDKVAAGQRHINLKWETTQQVIAVSVALTTEIICLYLVLYGESSMQVQAFVLISNGFFLVIGTYFQRTNHTKTGGVGQNETTR